MQPFLFTGVIVVCIITLLYNALSLSLDPLLSINSRSLQRQLREKVMVPQCCLPDVCTYSGTSKSNTSPLSSATKPNGSDFYVANFTTFIDIPNRRFRSDIFSHVVSSTTIMFERKNETYTYIMTKAGCWCYKVKDLPWNSVCIYNPVLQRTNIGNMFGVTKYGIEQVGPEYENLYISSQWATKTSNNRNADQVDRCWMMSNEEMLVSPDKGSYLHTETHFGHKETVDPQVFIIPDNCPSYNKC